MKTYTIETGASKAVAKQAVDMAMLHYNEEAPAFQAAVNWDDDNFARFSVTGPGTVVEGEARIDEDGRVILSLIKVPFLFALVESRVVGVIRTEVERWVKEATTAAAGA